MKSNSLYLICCVFVIQLFLGCSAQTKFISEVFSESENQTLNEILIYYDQFVYGKTNKNLLIEDAYLEFLREETVKVLDSGSFHFLIPSNECRKKLIDRLNKTDLKSILSYENPITILNLKNHKTRNVKEDYFFLNNSKFINLLETLSERTPFLKNYYEGIVKYGDFSPSIYTGLLSQYNNFDFRKKDERIAFIIPFLFSNSVEFKLEDNEMIILK